MLFEISYTVANYVTFWTEDTFVRTAPVQKVGVILKWNNSKSLDKGLPYVCNLLLMTTKFYFQNQPPNCRVNSYKFRSVYKLSKQKRFLVYVRLKSSMAHYRLEMFGCVVIFSSSLRHFNGYLVAHDVFDYCHCFEQNQSFTYKLYDIIRTIWALLKV